MLTKARLAGMKPEAITVEVGARWQRQWWDGSAPVVTIAVPDDYPMRTFDARPMMGCAVVVIALHDDADRLRDVVARITPHADSVQVFRLDGRTLAGNAWQRGQGWRSLREVAA